MPLARRGSTGVGTLLIGESGACEFPPPFDAEFPVGAGEVFLDHLHGHEKLLRDLPVGAATGRAPRHPQLARGQRLDAADAGASRPSTRGHEFLAGTPRDHEGSAAVGEV